MACIVSMVKDAPTGHKYYEDSLSARKIQRYRKDHSESSIRYRYRCRYCIRISVPESTAGSTEIPKYRISFGIPSSALNPRQAGAPKLPWSAGGLLTMPGAPNSAPLIGVVARNGIFFSKARKKSFRNYDGQFFAQLNIEVTKGHQMSKFTKFHISSEMCHYFRNYHR